MPSIIELQTENYKRISAVRLNLSPSGAIAINGRNAQGKSSVLDSIVALLCGAKNIATVPVRRGEDGAIIEAVINTEPPLRIRRTILESGKTTLKITQEANGISSTVKSPQKTLDALVGKIAFDPLEFTRLKTQQQMTLLKEIVGIDTDEIDKQLADALEERKLANRDAKQLEGQLAGMPQHDIDGPVDVGQLVDKLQAAQQFNRERDELKSEIESQSAEIGERLARIEQLKQQIADEERAVETLEESRNANIKSFDNSTAVEIEPIREQMDAAKDINEQAAANEQRAKVAKQVELKQAEASKLDERVESLREKRLALMDSATWPVEGLGFGPDGVTFNGLPFDQCSSAEQLKISTAIGLSQNPTIRLMIIRDGSLLDDESLAMVDQLARENDAQILVERVGQGKPGEIVIEDGEVAEQVAAQSA